MWIASCHHPEATQCSCCSSLSSCKCVYASACVFCRLLSNLILLIKGSIRVIIVSYSSSNFVYSIGVANHRVCWCAGMIIFGISLEISLCVKESCSVACCCYCATFLLSNPTSPDRLSALMVGRSQALGMPPLLTVCSHITGTVLQ